MNPSTPTRFVPTPHAVLPALGPAEALALGAEGWATAMERREEIIAQERSDPFVHGWEPPIWHVCDALLGLDKPWDPDWPAWAERMRLHLGFAEPVKSLLAEGGNRGGKSQWAGKRSSSILRNGKGKRCWAFHSSLPMSREYQQPVFYHYLPAELKEKDFKTRHTYIAYKEKTGFTEEQFILPGGSRTTFKSYDQPDALEGGEVDVIWADELVPRDQLETMELRVATRAGIIMITFTPVEGYSDTVAMFHDGATVVKESVAYLCPKDGGAPDVPRALGLTSAEYAEVQLAHKEKRAARCPQSRPEPCGDWLKEESREGAKWAKEGGEVAGTPPVGTCSPSLPSPASRDTSGVAGRIFEMVPRVMKCADPNRAVVFFHSNDNPYGNPKEVWSRIAQRGPDFIKERFYGIAKKQHAAAFRMFHDAVHVVKPEMVPSEGTNVQLTDPHGVGRNYFMLWIRSTPEHDYVYREWPGNYWIPDAGVPGPWALPGTKAHPDGVKGPGQTGFGFAHWQIKREIARLEGWKEYAQANGAPGQGLSESERVKRWDQWGARPEMVAERYIDSRFASVPKEVNDQPVTLLQELDEIGLTYKPTPGDAVSEGVRDIENALAYNVSEPISFLNKPRLLISSDCPNTIFALRIWTGLEKDRGATSEAIGLLRYFYRAGCSYLGGSEEEDDEDDNTWRS